MTNVAAKIRHRGLLQALALSRRSAFLSESRVSGVTSRASRADDRASGCRRVWTNLSGERWRERLEESQSEGWLEERMPNQSLELTATHRLARLALDYRTRRLHLGLARSVAVAQLLRSMQIQ